MNAGNRSSMWHGVSRWHGRLARGLAAIAALTRAGRPCHAVLLVMLVLAGGCKIAPVQRKEEVGRFRAYLDQQAKDVKIDPSQPLSLARCEELALANSLDLRTKQLALRLQDEQVRLALSGGLPKATLDARDVARSNSPSIKSGKDVVEVADRNQQSLSLQAVVPILDFGLTYYSYQIALDRRQQEKLLLTRAEQLLRRDVRIGYARHAGAIRQERLANLAYQAAQQVLRVAKSMERENLTVHADTALIESALAQANLELSLARQGVQESHLILSQLMSLPPGTSFAITDALPALAPPPTATLVSAYEDRALLARPELAVQDLERHASASAVRREASAFFPRLDGIGGFNWSSDSSLVNHSFFLGGVQVSHSLLDGGATIFRYNLAKKTVDLERERTLLISLGVLYEVDLRALRVRDAHATMVASQVLESARREALNRIISLYKEGLEDEAGAARSLADLTIQATALDRAQTDYLVAWHELEAAALPEASPTTQPATQPTTGPATTKATGL